MNVPSPSYREHLEFVPTALLAIAVLQYAGILGAPGEVDVVYLANLAIGIPIALYIQSLVLENIRWRSHWERMVRRIE